MKYTLRLQIDSVSELATFIQDLHVEVNMPFIQNQNNNDETLVDLTKRIVNYELQIQSLEKQLEYLANTTTTKLEKYLVENHPSTDKQEEGECQIAQGNQDAIGIETKLEPITNTETRKCQMCGKDVPPAKKAPFCSPRCYGKNWARDHSSKKVNNPNPVPG